MTTTDKDSVCREWAKRICETLELGGKFAENTICLGIESCVKEAKEDKDGVILALREAMAFNPDPYKQKSICDSHKPITRATTKLQLRGSTKRTRL